MKNCNCCRQIPGQAGVAKQDKIDKAMARAEKVNKMFPSIVKLKKCPKCKKNSLIQTKGSDFCAKCDYSKITNRQ